MKRLHGLLLSALLLAATAAAGADLPETPQDYARGAMLSLPQTASWYRVDLPLDVYASSAWPDLRDVRVFNHDGERVPFTLQTQNTGAAAPAAIPLRVFPLDASVATSTPAENVVRLHAPTGVEIQIAGSATKPVGQSYLLALPSEMPESFTLTQVKLTWQESGQSWRSKASLFASRDMREWDELQDDAPLLALASGNDRLKLDELNLHEMMPLEGVRYLLLVFDTPQLPVTITQATATLGREVTPLEQVQIESTGRQVSPGEAQFAWAQPQPLSALSVDFAEDVVLPVKIDWRSAADGEWQPLTKTVLWQRNERRSAPVEMAGEAVQAVRITTLDARLPETLPQVMGSRDRKALIFNAQGKGPFMLAWGNKAAQPAAVTPEELIPAALRKQMEPSLIPVVQTQDSVTLGGEERMTATSAADQQQRWKTLMVWGALLLGVAALVWMAIRIWREANRR